MFKSLFHNSEVKDPPIANFLFNNTASAVIWLIVRVWLGYQWISAAEHKITSPDWMVTGAALKGYWLSTIVTDPKPVIYFDWYRQFIQFLLDTQSYTWFAKVVSVGELAVGILLILGAFTGIAAFFGAFMNWNYIMAGTASSNPLLLVVAVALILAWKVAGYYGLDRFLLPMFGTPWSLGSLVSPKKKVEPATQSAPAR